jgi:hypothetical protein
MLISLFIEELFESLLHHTNLGKRTRLVHGHAEWQAGSTLQLQRIAHENLGIGTWKRTDEPIPVTKLGETLGVFDTSNPKHARLVKPSIEMNQVTVDGRVPAQTARVQYLRLPSEEHSATW